MLSALEIAKRKGARILTINPLREAGLLNFRNPQMPRGVVGHGTDLSDLHLPVKINGDLALFQAFGHLLLQWGAIDEEFIAQYTTGFEAWRAHVGNLDWDFVTSTTGLSRDQITEAAQMLQTVQGHGLLLGDGSHPAPQLGGRDQGGLQRRLRSRQHRQARCRPAPGPGALQRAGRSHHGHLGAPAGPFPRCVAGRVRIRSAPRARVRHGRRHPRAPGRQGQASSSDWAATSSRPLRTPT